MKGLFIQFDGIAFSLPCSQSASKKPNPNIAPCKCSMQDRQTTFIAWTSTVDHGVLIFRDQRRVLDDLAWRNSSRAGDNLGIGQYIERQANIIDKNFLSRGQLLVKPFRLDAVYFHLMSLASYARSSYRDPRAQNGKCNGSQS